MKIQIQTNPVFEEVELDLPHYCKSEVPNCHFWKILSEKETVHVLSAKYGTPCIEIYSTAVVDINHSIECSQVEFEDEYCKAMEYLNSKV